MTKKEIKTRSKMIRKNFEFELFRNIIMVLLIFIISFSISLISTLDDSHHNEKITNASTLKETSESETNIENNIVEFSTIEFSTTEENNSDLSVNDAYLLAKIAMAEAEGCPTETKEFVILTILNRVRSNNFPNTVEDVIFQKVNGTAQFTPTVNGRWERVEPNADCWTALHNVEEAIYDKSQGCTFFENCDNPDNWHSKNLIFLFESDGVRFYKEK